MIGNKRTGKARLSRRQVTLAVVALVAGFVAGMAVQGWPGTGDPASNADSNADSAAVAAREFIAEARRARWEAEARAGAYSAPPTPAPQWRAVQVQGCEEDEECFNPCTMGVNGLYPPETPEYHKPGPCDLFTPLPYGRRFAVAVTPEAAPPGVACSPDGWGYISVRVWVRERDGRDVPGAQVSEAGCADGANEALAEVTHRLYPQAGALA